MNLFFAKTAILFQQTTYPPNIDAIKRAILHEIKYSIDV